MRVISGRCRGRKLIEIQGRQIRPTSDRVKEAVFNILGQKVKNANVLDLFAGTGALGIEALSRGASHATFMDIDGDTIRQNLTLCGFETKPTCITCNIIKENIYDRLNGQLFDLIFIDPPYGKGHIEDILQKESFTDLLDGNGIIIAEHSHKDRLQLKISTLDIYRQKKYSNTIISFINKL